MLRHYLHVALALLTALAVPATARGVVVLMKGEEAPIMGYLVRQDEGQVVVRHQVGDAWRTTAIPRGQIDELIVTVDPARLAELAPDRPQLYREYAEELAEKRRDPEARDAAIRLYAIAATLGDPQVRRGALLGLIALARSADEERRFRAAAYLYDPRHDASVLAATSAATSSAPPAAGAEIAQAIRLARQGKSAPAKAIADRPTVRAELSGPSSSILTHDELLAACTARSLDDRQLARLIQAELALDPPLASASAAASAASPVESDHRRWSDALRKRGLDPVPAFDLGSLTEFDPAKSVYRNGEWVKP